MAPGDIGAMILRSQVGEYTNIKHLDNKLESKMEYIAFMDASGMAFKGVLSNEYIDKALEQKQKEIITAIYLYSNWRVWVDILQLLVATIVASFGSEFNQATTLRYLG